jgi:transposase
MAPMVHKYYSAEFRADAVALYCSDPSLTYAQVARDLGMHAESLRQWVRAAGAAPGPDGLLPGGTGPGAAAAPTTPEERIARLEAERRSHSRRSGAALVRHIEFTAYKTTPAPARMCFGPHATFSESGTWPNRSRTEENQRAHTGGLCVPLVALGRKLFALHVASPTGGYLSAGIFESRRIRLNHAHLRRRGRAGSSAVHSGDSLLISGRTAVQGRTKASSLQFRSLCRTAESPRPTLPHPSRQGVVCLCARSWFRSPKACRARRAASGKGAGQSSSNHHVPCS